MIDSPESYYCRSRRVKLVLAGVVSCLRYNRRATVRPHSHLSAKKTTGAFIGRRIRWLELTLVAGILVAVLGKDIQSVGYHGDEGRVIETSYFLGPFLKGEFFSPVWGVSYRTLTQPPVTRYIVGIGRRIGGFHSTDINILGWNWSLSNEANIARGAMPSPYLLWWSRLPMVFLAVLSGLVLFFLVSEAAGRLAGYVLVSLFILNPYFLTVLRRAMGESPLLAFILLAAFAGYRALTSWPRVEPEALCRKKRFYRSLIWFAFMGLFSGLAAGAKLNGMSVLLGGLALCAFCSCAQWKSAQNRYYAALSTCVLILATVITFVALNPFLYPNPLKRTKMMVQQRVTEMRAQQEWGASSSIDGSQRIPRIRRVFEDYATLHFAGARIINLLLFLFGLAYLIYFSWRWLKQLPSSGAGIVILSVAFATATPALFTPLDWDRYYLLPVVFSTTIIAVSIGRAISGNLERFRLN